MNWTRSGHTLRSNPRAPRISGSFKTCFRLNRFKLPSGWVYCRRRAYGARKNTLKTVKSQEFEKSDSAKCDVMDQLSIVTRYHIMIRSKRVAHKDNNGHRFMGRDEICDAPTPDADHNTYTLDITQNKPARQEPYLFGDDMKWKEVWSSLPCCPYFEIQNSNGSNKNVILMTMQKNEKEPNVTESNKAIAITSGASSTSKEMGTPLQSNRLIILRGPDNYVKSIPMCAVNMPLNKKSECPLSSIGLKREVPNTMGANFTSESLLPTNDKKSWSLFRISNGSVIPLYWIQNNQSGSVQARGELQNSDLNVNNANWFTKSVLSNMIGTEEQSARLVIKSPDSNKRSLNCCANSISSLPSLHEESDSQKLVRSCHEFVYDNSGSQIHRCKSCSKLFTSISAFCDHVVSMHNQAKNRCGVCHKHFSRSWLLKGHMRTHTGERPYKCHHPGCNKAFADKSNLRSHTLIHTVVGKKFVCQRCQRAFAQKRYLHKHQFEVCKILI